MKKTLTLGLASLAMLGLASCNDSDAKNESSITFLADAFNLYSPLSGTGDCYAAFGTYSLKLEFPAQVVTMSATNMSTPNGGKTNFVLKPVQFQATGVEVDDNYREIFKFSAIDATESGDVVRGLTASLTQGFYQPQTIEGLDYKVLMPNAYAFPYYFVTEYQLNNHWRVRTFWPDETFRGTTAVGTGSSAKYLNDKMEYRVVIETDKNGALGKTADVIIYNAQFSEKMPAQKAIVIKGLEVSYNPLGWAVKGSGIVPQYVADGKLQDFPAFTFNKFEMQATGDLTTVSANYQVAGRYEGSFTGSCLEKAKAE